MSRGRKRTPGPGLNRLALALALVFSLGALALTALPAKDEPAEPAAEAAPSASREEPPAPAVPDESSASAPSEEPPAAEPVLLGESEGSVVPRGEARTPRSGGPPGAGEDLTLSVPRLGLRDVPLPTGSTQERLDREGVMRLSGTGLPWEAGTNTFIVGHTLGYEGTKFPYVFYELDQMRPGDKVVLKSAAGERYVFRVYDEVTVRPQDYWVTYPTDDRRTVVSLQSCVPIPELDKRLVVQAELVGGS